MSALCLGRPLLHQPLSATVAQTVLCRFEKAELVSAFFAERHNIHLRKAKMRIVSDDHRDNPEEDVAQPVLTPPTTSVGILLSVRSTSRAVSSSQKYLTFVLLSSMPVSAF